MIGYSGKFVLRLSPELHKELTDIARNKRASLNGICVELIKRGLMSKEEDLLPSDPFAEVVEGLEKHFKNKLMGVVLFGSYVTGELTSTSDIDLLIVLDPSAPLIRSLYRWWDNNISWREDRELSPHFVHYPKNLEAVTGIWFEVAENNRILYEKKGSMQKVLSELSDMIMNGRVRKYISNGHPYWVWRDREE